MVSFAHNEVERVSCLAEYDLVGTALEDEFNEIAAVAARLFDARIGGVTVVGLDQMWLRGCIGIEPSEFRREHAFCSHTILQDEPLVVGDLTKDPRFAHLPYVLDEPRLRFYAGAPTQTAQGLNLGAVCVIDPTPRAGITPVERDVLTGLARIAARAFDQRLRRSKAETEAEAGTSRALRALHLSEITPFRANARGGVTWINPGSPTLARLVDASTGTFAWINHVHPADAESLLLAWRSANARASPFSAEFRLKDADDGWRWFHARAQPDPSLSTLEDWFGTMEDVHQRRQDAERIRRLEAELGHMSRVSAMGTMASTLAHELNQPLAAITNYVRAGKRLIAMGDDGQAPLAEAMEGAVNAATRAGGIVRSMRELVSQGDLHRRRVDVEPLVREAFRIAVVELPIDGVEILFDIHETASVAVVDPLQIQQVIVNLIRNAVQAMGEAPTRRLTIRVRPYQHDQIEISVTDTGPGIDPGIAAHLFTPFNSSKSDGMGIGLSISRTIVEAHGGRIEAEPGERGGTRFRFSVPTC